MSSPAFAVGLHLPRIYHRRSLTCRRPRMTVAQNPVPATCKKKEKPQHREVDVVVVGSGIGGLTTAAQIASNGGTVGVLESYIIPGGSSGWFERGEYRFDVGASMIFGFGSEGTTNLLTRALSLVGKSIETIPDPVQVHYHLPEGLDVRVHRDYEQFLLGLIAHFPHEERGIRHFYNVCWSVFNSLNEMPLLSLEEPAYLLRVFLQHPLACLNLARYLATNAGDIARAYVKDPTLLRFIDMECYSWSVAPAERTPLINAGMVFSDRHYGGVNYPRGGVGCIAAALAEGIAEQPGCWVECSAHVSKILFEDGKACGVQLSDGRVVRAKIVVSNATRWDTFGERGLVAPAHVPPEEITFRERYVKSPSFTSIHLGVRADALQVDMREEGGMDCHHILLDDWAELETARDARGTLFVSVPTVLDATVAPSGRHIFHVFVPSWADEWTGLSRGEYAAQKEKVLSRIVGRLERIFPGLRVGIEIAEVGTPRTHRRFLRRQDGSYGPVPARKLPGLLSMPFNRTGVKGLYCVGDSTFPGQGLNATAFSGFSCGHRIAADLGLVDTLPAPFDRALTKLLSTTRLKL